MKKNNLITLSFFFTFSFFLSTLHAIPEPTTFEKVSFFKAVETGDLKKAKTLFKKNANLVFQKNHLKETPLLVALKKGYQKLITFLLKKKSPINDQDKDGHTPLHFAILLNQHKLVEQLLNDGADATKATHDGYLPLHYAAAIGNLLTVLRLIPETKDLLNQKTKDRKTPLHCAASNSHENIVNILLQKGAQLDQTEDILEDTFEWWNE